MKLNEVMVQALLPELLKLPEAARKPAKALINHICVEHQISDRPVPAKAINMSAELDNLTKAENGFTEAEENMRLGLRVAGFTEEMATQRLQAFVETVEDRYRRTIDASVHIPRIFSPKSDIGRA